jgi:hypothetical protein
MSSFSFLLHEETGSEKSQNYIIRVWVSARVLFHYSIPLSRIKIIKRNEDATLRFLRRERAPSPAP